MSPADCAVILGDFNSILPRLYRRLTGRWCVHTLVDNHGGGTALLDLMQSHNLFAVSTIHQPRRGHTNATFMPRDPRYKPQQIDYILCSKRWCTSVRSSRVKWGISIQRWGRKYDHGLVECNWKVKISMPAIKRKPDFAALKDSETAELFNNIVVSELQNYSITAPENPTHRLARLNLATKKAITSLPTKRRQPTRKRHISNHTRELIAKRAQYFNSSSREECRQINREISRSCRNDYRTYINDVVQDIAAAAEVGNLREVNRLTRMIFSKPRAGNIMPSKDPNDARFTTSEQLADAWYKFMENKFSSVDNPGAAYTPSINHYSADEDTVTREEFDSCVSALRTGRAPGVDETPIEVYLASPAAKAELYNVVQLMWRTEHFLAEFVHTLFVMSYKKGARDDFANYRAIGLLCHAYKVVSVLILKRMQPFLEERLPDSQAGFRKARGCRDNVLILKLLINEVIKAGEEAVVTFIDYTAAFDSTRAWPRQMSPQKCAEL